MWRLCQGPGCGEQGLRIGGKPKPPDDHYKSCEWSGSRILTYEYIIIIIYIYIISWGHSFLLGCSGLKHFWMTALWSAVSEASVARRYGPERQHASLGQMNWSLSLLNYIYITLVIYYPVATRFIYRGSPSLRLQDSVFETPRCHELINPRGPVQIQKSRLETSHRKVSPKPRSCKRG